MKTHLIKIIGFIILVFSFSIVNAKEILTYKGEFPFNFSYSRNPVASYSYYEADDYSRIYHGPFVLKFYGEGTTKNNIKWGKIEGNFKDGYYDGEWTMTVPMDYSNKSTKDYYTTILRCNFINGLLEGPLTIVMKNAAGKEIIKTTLNYKRGKLDGDIAYFNNISISDNIWMAVSILELSGQYKNGEPVGKWKYTYGRNKGFANFDENENYTINSKTGAKEKGEELGIWNLDYLYLHVADFIRALSLVSNDQEKFNTASPAVKESEKTEF